MTFYLGTDSPSWLRRTDVPLFISHRRLRRRKTFPRALARWALDSGGFSEISLHGAWLTTVSEYVEAVQRYAAAIGPLDWAAPMDWMCEPAMIEKTGLSVREHQERTVANYLELRGRGPFIPVLQGWTLDDYLRCVDLYADAGVNLSREVVVGLGSVCRRQNEKDIGRIVVALQPLRLHGFGVKKSGLTSYGHLLASSDSMAWSFRARRSPKLYGCEHRGTCAHCLRFALKWRAVIVNGMERPSLFGGAA